MLVLLLNRVGNAAIKRLAVLLAIVAGTVIALLTGQADFSAVVQGQRLALPGMFNFGRPVFDVAAIVSMTLIVLVLLAETTAGLLAIGDIIGSEVDGKRISRGLRADMLTSAMAPLFNSFPQSAFAQNIGLVAMTGVKSRFVVAAGGVILLLLGFYRSSGAWWPQFRCRCSAGLAWCCLAPWRPAASASWRRLITRTI